jgi:dTDP-4-amino-4,6-dideoxygalactose transaminase
MRAARALRPEDVARFAIGFDPRDRARLHALIDDVLDAQQWTEGPLTRRFEAAWGARVGQGAVATGSWTGAALCVLRHLEVGPGDVVLCPSNTFMATPLAVLACGARVAFVDCTREDLCLSPAALERALDEHEPKAVVVVHIGGHLAFGIERIAELCRQAGVALIEDCAHAHGASWHGRAAGSWGDAGVWSFYATKTVSTGEGGMVTSRHADLLEFARAYRNYGKPGHEVPGLGLRMSEFTAALGVLACERLAEIVAFKNDVARRVLDPRHPGRLRLPDGMVSGLYKYVVFDPIEGGTGRVYAQPCHRLMGTGEDLPATDWVAEHHWCVPLYYRPQSPAVDGEERAA